MEGTKYCSYNSNAKQKTKRFLKYKNDNKRKL